MKDIFTIQGLRMGLGSRAYTELYPPASSTAPAIQILLDAGAQLVGISKMCSMVLKAPPTQCIDLSAPFNPRGDGYHSPSGGSSGSAVAVAAYDWIDFAIASDCKSDESNVICDLLLILNESHLQWADARTGEWMFLFAAYNWESVH